MVSLVAHLRSITGHEGTVLDEGSQKDWIIQRDLPTWHYPLASAISLLPCINLELGDFVVNVLCIDSDRQVVSC